MSKPNPDSPANVCGVMQIIIQVLWGVFVQRNRDCPLRRAPERAAGWLSPKGLLYKHKDLHPHEKPAVAACTYNDSSGERGTNRSLGLAGQPSIIGSPKPQ